MYHFGQQMRYFPETLNNPTRADVQRREQDHIHAVKIIFNLSVVKGRSQGSTLRTCGIQQASAT